MQIVLDEDDRNPEPWYSFYWNADSARDELNEIKDAVIN